MNKKTIIYEDYIIEIYHETHIVIRKMDKSPVNPTWYELQYIKNIAIGIEAYAVEVYPSEEDLVDNANIRHLWKVNKEDIPSLR